MLYSIILTLAVLTLIFLIIRAIILIWDTSDDMAALDVLCDQAYKNGYASGYKEALNHLYGYNDTDGDHALDDDYIDDDYIDALIQEHRYWCMYDQEARK